MAKKKKEEKPNIVTLVRDRLKAGFEAESENRELALEDIRFENGEQWEQETERERTEDGRPCLVINKVAGTVKQVIGDARQNRFSVKVRPVDDKTDPKVAEIFTGLIRNIENVSDAESAYDNAFEGAVRGGFGYFRIVTVYSSEDAFDQDIRIDRVVNPFSVIFDPAAKKTDKSDAKWCIVQEVISKEEFEKQFPDKQAGEIDKGTGQDFDDWFTEEGVRVAEQFEVKSESKKLLFIAPPKDTPPEVVMQMPPDVVGYLGKTVYADELPEGMEEALRGMGFIKRERETECQKVVWHKVSGTDILEGPKDWAGKYIPIVPVFGEEVWIEGKPVYRSAIRFAKDPQRLYNWARSTAVETMALAPKQPFIGTPEAIEGHEQQWANAHRKAQGILLYNLGHQAPQRQPSSIPDSGALQEAMQSADDIKATTGLFDASLGAKGNETSGRAILAREKQGDTATFVFTDNLTRAIRHCGRILVDLIPKIYDTDRVVRLLNEDGSDGWAKINHEENGRKINDLSIGKFDVVVSAGPNYSTKRLEAADGMIQLTQAAPQFAPVIMPRLAKNLDWPEADKIAEEMKQISQPQPNPMAQLEGAKLQAEVQGKQIENASKQQEMAMQGPEQMQMMQQVAMQVVSEAFKRMGLI